MCRSQPAKDPRKDLTPIPCLTLPLCVDSNGLTSLYMLRLVAKWLIAHRLTPANRMALRLLIGASGQESTV